MNDEEFPSLEDSKDWIKVMEVLADPKTGHLAVKCSIGLRGPAIHTAYTGYVLASITRAMTTVLIDKFPDKKLNAEQLDTDIKESYHEQLKNMSGLQDPFIIDRKELDQ